jgi:cysteine protease ATG4
MDPSMLIGFLIRDEEDWKKWRATVSKAPGKSIIHVADSEPVHTSSLSMERPGAIDEVETFDTEDDDI